MIDLVSTQPAGGGDPTIVRAADAVAFRYSPKERFELGSHFTPWVAPTFSWEYLYWKSDTPQECLLLYLKQTRLAFLVCP